jgi:nitrite reductase/ring-hydroxylating ferredoxin subunit
MVVCSGLDMNFVDVLAESALPKGALSLVSVGIARVLLCHGESGIFAIEDKCPHAGMPLNGGKIDGDVIRCPSHNAKFNLQTGQPTVARTLGAVKTFPVMLDGGRILVDPS